MSEKYKKNKRKDSHLQKICWSQNFLTSRRLLERIVRKSTITGNDIVLEIGTGKGHLTETAHPPSEIWLVMERVHQKNF